MVEEFLTFLFAISVLAAMLAAFPGLRNSPVGNRRSHKKQSTYYPRLTLNEKSLGPNHPAVASVLEKYANFLRTMNRDAEADKLENCAKAIRAKNAQEIHQS